MKENDVLQLIKYYRHQFMNDLQIIQGYLNINKLDKVESKINEYIVDYSKELELIDSQTPNFTLWILQFNAIHKNIRLTYEINTNKKLHIIDHKLMNKCQFVISKVLELGSTDELYEVHIQIHSIAVSTIQVKLCVDGEMEQYDYFKQEIEKMSSLIVNKKGQQIVCTFHCSI